MSRRFLAPKKCEVCGKSYKPKRYDQKYCSESCRKKVKRRQWRDSKRRTRDRVAKILREAGVEELRERGYASTHEVKVPEVLGTEARSTDLSIVKDRKNRDRVAGKLWLGKKTHEK